MGDLLSPKMNLPPVEPVKQADMQDESVIEAKKKKMREEEARAGRSSTDLASGGSAAPKTYTNTQLGS